VVGLAGVLNIVSVSSGRQQTFTVRRDSAGRAINA